MATRNPFVPEEDRKWYLRESEGRLRCIKSLAHERMDGVHKRGHAGKTRGHLFPNVDIYSAFGYSYPRVFGHVYIIDLYQYVFGYL